MTRSSEDPVAIVGPGAIGMSIGAALARAGHPLIVCGGRPFARIELTSGERAESWPVIRAAGPADVAQARTAIVAVKSQQTPAAAPWLAALARPDATVLVAQNGVEQRQHVAPYVGPAHVVPAVVYLAVERLAPGRAVHTPTDSDRIVVPDDPWAGRIAAEMRAGGLRVRQTADFATEAWAKLCRNAVLNPLTALTCRRVGVLRDPRVADVALRLLRETAAAGRAEGAALPPDAPERVLRYAQDLPAGMSSSMLQDRVAGRALEYDALTGAVIRAAQRHGIDVPASRIVYALLAALRPLPIPAAGPSPREPAGPQAPRPAAARGNAPTTLDG